MITTVLVTGAWVTNLFAKPLATLFGGCVTLIGIGIAFVTYRRARRRGPSPIFPHIYHHQQPIVFMSKGRRLPAARVLALLPHDPDQAVQLAKLGAADTSGRPVAFVYIAPRIQLGGKLPRCSRSSTLTAMTSPRRRSSPEGRLPARKARLDSRFIYVPAGAPEGTVEWLVKHIAPQETIMLDDGAGLASADRFTLERRRAGDTPVLHYRAKHD